MTPVISTLRLEWRFDTTKGPKSSNAYIELLIGMEALLSYMH